MKVKLEDIIEAMEFAADYIPLPGQYDIEETPKKSNTSARGSLAKYANTALWEEEETAWEKKEVKDARAALRETRAKYGI